MLIGLRELGVSVVGTARARRGWAPKEINNISEKQFNTLHFINDKRKIPIKIWINNNVFTMITNIPHTRRDSHKDL